MNGDNEFFRLFAIVGELLVQLINKHAVKKGTLFMTDLCVYLVRD